MDEGRSTVTKGVKTPMFYGWKYRHYFVVLKEGITTYEHDVLCAHQPRSIVNCS